ncbi:MAG: hypothetical protein IH571_07215 [Acholeplasmataceae bacterium]|nr:hypothetical protein [Acholeplasmataceae bacterium]
MELLGMILVVYGAFVLLGLIMQFPFFYNNPKAKLFLKKIGKTAYNLIIFIFGAAAIVVGLFLIL